MMALVEKFNRPDPGGYTAVDATLRGQNGKESEERPPLRNDVESIERLREHETNIFEAAVDFDDIVDAILTAPSEEIKTHKESCLRNR